MVKKISSRAGIPFRISLRRPLMMLDVEVNGFGPFNFVLDTGASFCVLTPDTARAAGVLRAAKIPTAIGAGGRVNAGLAKLRTLRLGPHEARNLEVALISLDEVEKHVGVKVAGLIGYNFLKKYIVTIDYPARRLWLKRPGRAVVRR